MIEDVRNKLTAHMTEELFFLDLEVIEDSPEVIKELQKDHDIYCGRCAGIPTFF
jgi:5'(3')-deoxyribonucleotidase